MADKNRFASNTLVGGVVKNTTFSGTTNSNGTLVFSGFTNNDKIPIAVVFNSASYFGHIGFQINSGWRIRVTDATGAVIASTSVSGTVFYLDNKS